METTVIKSANKLSIITVDGMKGYKLVNPSLGIYQKVDATGKLVESNGKNRPFMVVIEGKTAIQSQYGFDIKTARAFNSAKDLETMAYFSEEFASLSKNCKIHTNLSYTPDYEGQPNVKYRNEKGEMVDADVDGAIYYRKYIFAPDTFVPSTLETSQKEAVKETIDLSIKANALAM